MIVRISLAGVPVGKGRPRISTVCGVIRAFTPTKTRDYEEQLKWAAREAMRSRPPFVGPIRLNVTAYMPVPPSWPRARQQRALDGRLLPECLPDADNVLKAISDALNAVAYVDDRQVFDARVKKLYAADPRIEIIVETIDPLDIAGELGRLFAPSAASAAT